MRCPQCSEQLVEQKVRGPSTEVDHCAACGGFWFDQGEVAEVLGARAVHPLPFPADAAVNASRDCPRCHQPLVLFAYPGTLTVIDACRQCHGIWFDADELKGIHEARSQSRMSCPKCGSVQPEAESCATCGVLVAKVRAAAAERSPELPRVRRPTPPAPASEPRGLKQSILSFIDAALARLWAGIRG